MSELKEYQYTMFIPEFQEEHMDDRLYGVWRGMFSRCYNPNSTSYYRYGGRGISICNEWRDFDTFKAWALPHGYDYDAPRGECTIDRIDNDGNYEPDNCRWTTIQENIKNRPKPQRKAKAKRDPKPKKPKEPKERKKPKREVLTWEIDGVTKTIAEWCDEYNMNYCTVMDRIKRGMTPKEALTTEKVNYYAMKRRYSFSKKKTMR